MTRLSDKELEKYKAIDLFGGTELWFIYLKQSVIRAVDEEHWLELNPGEVKYLLSTIDSLKEELEKKLKEDFEGADNIIHDQQALLSEYGEAVKPALECLRDAETEADDQGCIMIDDEEVIVTAGNLRCIRATVGKEGG